MSLFFIENKEETMQREKKKYGNNKRKQKKERDGIINIAGAKCLHYKGDYKLVFRVATSLASLASCQSFKCTDTKYIFITFSFIISL